MKKLFCFLLCIGLCSCVSPSTRLALAEREKQITELQIKVNEAEKTKSEELGSLQQALADAQAKFATEKANAATEKMDSGLGIGQTIFSNLSPVAAIFLPPLGMLFSALAAGLGTARKALVKQ